MDLEEMPSSIHNVLQSVILEWLLFLVSTFFYNTPILFPTDMFFPYSVNIDNESFWSKLMNNMNFVQSIKRNRKTETNDIQK